MKRDIYAEVSARIVAELEAGAAPWVKPWSATPGANTPCNAVTNRPYSGCNVILLWMAQRAGYRTPRYLTFKQALELGGHVRKGERGTKVYFVKQLEIRDDGDDNLPTRLDDGNFDCLLKSVRMDALIWRNPRPIAERSFMRGDHTRSSPAYAGVYLTDI